jgi:hypothetical protein
MQPAVARSIQPAVSLLEKTPVLFDTLLRDLPEVLLHWKPAPERWSIAEVLGHLADIEQVYADRVRRILTEDSPFLQRYDLEAAKASGDYSRESARHNLALFLKTRRATVILLKSISPSAGERIATHSELGAITLDDMLNEWASHDLGHLRQIAELYRARAFHPNSGPFQQYSHPNP